MLRRCKEEPGDLALLYATATLMYHFADHVAKHSGHRFGAVVVRLIAHHRDFELIQAVANATKHVNFDQNPRNPHKGVQAYDVRTGRFPISFPHRFIHEPYVDLPDGSYRLLLPLFKQTLEQMRTFQP